MPGGLTTRQQPVPPGFPFSFRAKVEVDRINTELRNISSQAADIRKHIGNNQIFAACEEYDKISPYFNYIPLVKDVNTQLKSVIPNIISLINKDFNEGQFSEYERHILIAERTFPENEEIKTLHKKIESFLGQRSIALAESTLRIANKKWCGLAFIFSQEASKHISNEE